MKRVIVLGATGSVGSSALAVIREHPEDFRVVGLVAGRGGRPLADLAHEFPEARIALGRDADPEAFAALLDAPARRRFLAGPDGALRLIAETAAEVCVAAVSGTAGLELAFAAAARGLTILLANKEVLVSAGRLFKEKARAGGSLVLPIDSEHTALWQCLEKRDPAEVAKLIITASGGPFRDWPAERIALATPADALRHPVWAMGAKISVDSATLANKALELIEAHHLFDFAYDAMEVLVHRQSLVHGMIEFVDGAVIAHIGAADMRLPIAYMLFHPRRRANALPRLDFAAVGRLDFERPDPERFPLLGIGVEAGRRGGRHPALFNAANEAAVELFLAGRLSFAGIAGAVRAAMADADADAGEFTDVSEVMDIHARARQRVETYAKKGEQHGAQR